MRTKSVIFTVLLLAAVAMTSCFGPSNEPTFVEADLLGLWVEDGTQAYVRFTSEKDDAGEYKYGREWNEEEDVVEGDLVPYGNGWFKYKLVQSDLTEIHLMDNGAAEQPKVYVVTKLTDTELHYKDDFGRTHSFSKVVESH